jgi:hypothetical protein
MGGRRIFGLEPWLFDRIMDSRIIQRISREELRLRANPEPISDS